MDAYLQAKEVVLDSGYWSELDRQEVLDARDIGESHFLREAAWVILASGFREQVVRSRFPAISSAFHQWADAGWLAPLLPSCRAHALEVFANTRKIDAICGVILRVAADGFASVMKSVHDHGLEYLLTYPMIGPATGLHLLKNLGFPVVKPDRHLRRIAARAGFASPMELCAAIGDGTGDSVAVVDTVLWRFATLREDYLVVFS